MFKRFSLISNAEKFKDTAFDVIVCMGQSNCAGYGKGNKELSFLPDNAIFAYKNGKVVLAKERKSSLFDYRGVFALYFAQLYKNKCLEENRKILILPAAVGGTGFSNSRWGVNDDLYLNAVRMTCEIMQKFPDSKLACVLWHQGETDAENGMDAIEYKEKLSLLINDFRKRVNCKDLPFIAGDYVQDWKKLCPHSYKISEATQEVVRSTISCAYVSSVNLEGNCAEDIIHFSRKSLKELGKRYFEKYLQLIADK